VRAQAFLAGNKFGQQETGQNMKILWILVALTVLVAATIMVRKMSHAANTQKYRWQSVQEPTASRTITGKIIQIATPAPAGKTLIKSPSMVGGFKDEKIIYFKSEDKTQPSLREIQIQVPGRIAADFQAGETVTLKLIDGYGCIAIEKLP
jgi:hypothetical protein